MYYMCNFLGRYEHHSDTVVKQGQSQTLPQLHLSAQTAAGNPAEYLFATEQSNKLAQALHRGGVAPGCMIPPAWMIRLAPRGTQSSSVRSAVHSRAQCSSAKLHCLAAGSSDSSLSPEQQPSLDALFAVHQNNVQSLLSTLQDQNSTSSSSRGSSSNDAEVPVASSPKRDRKLSLRKRSVAVADNNALSIIPGVGPKNASLLGSKDIHDIPCLMRVFLEEHKADSEATKRYLQVSERRTRGGRLKSCKPAESHS